MSKILKIILPIILTLGLVITSCASGSEPTKAVVGQPTPNFELQSLDGQSVSLKDFKGKPVVINFWASWCGPCIYEMPFFQEIHDEWSSKGLVLLAINKGEGLARVSQFMQYYNLSLSILLDTKEVVAQRYNVIGIPVTFFIDEDGIIQEKVIGAFPNKAEIEARVSKLME